MLVEYGIRHILPEVDQLRLLQFLTDERPDDEKLLFADIRGRCAVSCKEMNACLSSFSADGKSEPLSR